ncbi:ABC transporter ATP-binding protein [Mobiluncus curtisii]|uniref:Fatty acid ABC transporter ATP-binding/permease protein n=2 Tax=Mobiluncus curtisii TaxID=2051 RepID=A0A7Y0UHV7_9ACTO|nr:ABC transporter ATP-binding protein [Mobiluncus curtisii]MCV0000668.1 ABC transporter ATP-binding protein [Mobiluncus curtisii]NMW48493.1 ABC transporter ATP-binding protein [Mobiluncus curtisii]NMW87588.1 ABC transporter ATP-binding protein [Mobiluncus curtisii]NMX13235.1 ABC transporter ATP-binding protein [Mobiluncus curtisii]
MMVRRIFQTMSASGRAMIIRSVLGFVIYAWCGVAIMLTALIAIKSALDDTMNLAIISAIIAGLLVIKTGAGIVADKQKHQAGFDLTFQIRCRIVAKLKKLSLGYYTKSRLGEISEIIHKDVDNMELVVGHLWTRMFADIIVSITILAGLSYFDWRMTLLMIAALPVGIVWLVVGLHHARRLEKEVGNAGANVASLFVEYVRGMPVLKAFSRSRSLDELLSSSVTDFGVASTRAARNRVFVLSIYNLIVDVSFVIAITGGLFMALAGKLDIFSFLVFVVVAPELYKPFFALEGHWMNYLKAVDSFTRILKVTEAPAVSEVENPTKPHSFDIEFDHVTFSYDGKNLPTLADVSFTVPEGSLCALVGESGAGKTTITNLLLRFWDVDAGAIKIGGVDVRNMRYDDLLEQTSIVMQDVKLFADTVAGNIRIGRADASDEDIVKAAKAARLHDFITTLPDGYDTVLGENGVGLSGGQRQRLSVARAFLKDAPIVVLDEPTANVDPINEALMQEAITALTKNRTVLVITHRLSTVQSADQILVLHDGRIIQKGTHQQLLASPNGPYRLLWDKTRTGKHAPLEPQNLESAR